MTKEVNSKSKMAPEEGPDGIDRWTSNGHGITFNGKRLVQVAGPDYDSPDYKFDEIEEVE